MKDTGPFTAFPRAELMIVVFSTSFPLSTREGWDGGDGGDDWFDL